MKVAVLAPYPRLGACSGIADYTATILQALDTQNSDSIVVYADRRRGEPITTSRAGSLTIRRCWVPGWSAPFRILLTFLHEKVDVLHVEYDIYLFGGILSALLIPLLLAFLRYVRRVDTVATLHGIVPLSEVTDDLLKENGLTFPFSRIGRLGFATLYRLFALGSTRVIALEKALANILITDYGFPADRVYSVPHPLMKEDILIRQMPHNNGKSLTKLFFFGYASYYKGLDILIQAFEDAQARLPDLALVIASAPHPRLADNRRYNAWYRDIMTRAHNAGVETHGWLTVDELQRQLSLCSAMILPYTHMYGASGPLNTAIAARRPVLVSTRVYFDGAEPCQVFSPDVKACSAAIHNFFTRNESSLNLLTRGLAESRDTAGIASANHLIRTGDLNRDCNSTASTIDLLAVRADPTWKSVNEAI